VSFVELRIAKKEKNTSILELRQAAETTRADLEKEKKQVEGNSPPVDGENPST
jgi:Tfp pilus assembly protein PilO